MCTRGSRGAILKFSSHGASHAELGRFHALPQKIPPVHMSHVIQPCYFVPAPGEMCIDKSFLLPRLKMRFSQCDVYLAKENKLERCKPDSPPRPIPLCGASLGAPAQAHLQGSNRGRWPHQQGCGLLENRLQVLSPAQPGPQQTPTE